MFDTEVLIENETIKSSRLDLRASSYLSSDDDFSGVTFGCFVLILRWPCMRSFADPEKHLGEQNQSLPSAEEPSVTPTKNQASKKTS